MLGPKSYLNIYQSLEKINVGLTLIPPPMIATLFTGLEDIVSVMSRSSCRFR